MSLADLNFKGARYLLTTYLKTFESRLVSFRVPLRSESNCGELVAHLTPFRATVSFIERVEP